MTNHPDDLEAQLAAALERWTAELNHADGIQVRAILAASASQLAIRIGPANAAAELLELASNLNRAERRRRAN